MIPAFKAMLFLMSVCAPICAGDLAKVMAEPNLEKRSEKAWQNAGVALDDAKKALKAGQMDKEKLAIEEVRASVDLTKKSLDDTGKNPRNSSKYFRKAEIGLRNLIRRLDSFRLEHDFDERPRIEQLIQHTEKVRNEILTSVLEKK